MQGDFSKMFLFVVLALVVLVMVSADKWRRPLAAASLDGSTPTDESQGVEDQDAGMLTRGAGWAGVPNYRYGQCPPLSLMTPKTGVQPAKGC